MFRVVAGCMVFVLGCLVLLGVAAWMHSSEPGTGEGARSFAAAMFDRNEARFREMLAFMDAHPKVGVFARKPLMCSQGTCLECDRSIQDGAAGEPGYEAMAREMEMDTKDVRRMMDLMKRSRVRRIVHHVTSMVYMLDMPAWFPSAGCVCIVHVHPGEEAPELQRGMSRAQLREDGWHVVHNLDAAGKVLAETPCADAWR